MLYWTVLFKKARSCNVISTSFAKFLSYNKATQRRLITTASFSRFRRINGRTVTVGFMMNQFSFSNGHLKCVKRQQLVVCYKCYVVKQQLSYVRCQEYRARLQLSWQASQSFCHPFISPFIHAYLTWQNFVGCVTRDGRDANVTSRTSFKIISSLG